MKIKLVEPLGIHEEKIDSLLKQLIDMGNDVIKYTTVPKDEAELASRCEDAEIVIIANTPMSDAVIMNAKNLKMISVAFTGVDHIGIKHINDNNIVVSNSAGYSDNSVAELVIALTLNLLRNVKSGDYETRIGGTIKGLIGNELSGKKVGLVGVGKIGFKTATLFSAFGCELIGFDPHPSDVAIKLGIKFMSIEDVMKNSDIVSLHLPLIPSTVGLVDRKILGLMKSNAILINCARGPIVDNNALSDVLNNNLIAGAGIDVFDMEPPIPSDYPLMHAKNTIFTPHVAYATEESMLRRAEIAVNNVVNFLNGTPQNVMPR